MNISIDFTDEELTKVLEVANWFNKNSNKLIKELVLQDIKDLVEARFKVIDN